MALQFITVQPTLAQAPAQPVRPGAEKFWMGLSGALLITLIGLGIFTKFRYDKLVKARKFEEHKNRELKKKLKLALDTISKMEKNPDLLHSREFNLDYLRLRMEEKQFHFAIVNQIKIRVKEKISLALRPQQAEQGTLGIASNTRQVDEIFDVNYDLTETPGGRKGVLFRIQIKLAKLPTQPTSVTVSQIIQCLESYMSQNAEESWQPTIQGRIASLHWDQKAKPTPLLVLEQSTDGVNVTFKTTPMVKQG